MQEKEYEYEISMEAGGTAVRALQMVGTGKRVLELGCSVGVQSRVLTEQLGCQVVGVEINASAARRAERYCTQVIVGSLDELNLEKELAGQKFDVVLCADVLEHIRAPSVLLRGLKPLLATDAQLVGLIRNFAYCGVIFELLQGNFKYRKTGLLDDSHIHFFTRESLFSILTTAGFSVDILERATVTPNLTEFETRPVNAKQQALLDCTIAANIESLTYHFIVKASISNLQDAELHAKNTAFEIADTEKFKLRHAQMAQASYLSLARSVNANKRSLASIWARSGKSAIKALIGR